MGTVRHLLIRALVTGTLGALVGGAIAFVLLPVYLVGVHPWEFGFNWRIIAGSGSPGAPGAGQVLRAAAGFALLGATVGFVGGFCAGLRADPDADEH